MSTKDKNRGALLGLAVGDAVGTSVEFYRPGTFELVDDMLGGGVHRLPVGAWTDDTSMALCLAESILETGRMDLRDQLERYVRWYREGYYSSVGECFDIGNSTRDALEYFERTGDPFAGMNFPDAAGNGSIMRLAPVPMAYRGSSRDTLTEKGFDSSRTTHGDPRAIEACGYLTHLIAGLINGESKEEALERYEEIWASPSEANAELLKVTRGSYRQKEPPEIKGSGFVIQSLEAALWAFYKHDNYRDTILAAVNLGNDADTTAAIAGQMAGALYGESGIPDDWLEKIYMREEITELADRLYDFNRNS